MGIKDLWTVLTPYCDRRPFHELRGKVVAIDLAGWVCESLNTVDYFIHPRQHLKNLFFRTCYLVWEEVTPVFVLEGTAPKLKAQVIAKRNEIHFRGVKPKNSPPIESDIKETQRKPIDKDKTRNRFNHVLKQCENLLNSMGIICVKGPGEGEAYCAFLNKKGLVDGIISQDSDCFAYGAIKVYRNFSVSSQGTASSQGGCVDVYDMTKICQHMDFGQNKIITMGLLCGCDYCPEGVGGVGRDCVMKLFNRYSNEVILDRLKSWRSENHKYTSLEMRVDDKHVCTNCGHIGRSQSHTKNGCPPCGMSRGCNSDLWKEERLSLKSELSLRKKALADPTFPSQDIIDEFLQEPSRVPQLDLCWKQPNIVKFVKQVRFIKETPANSVAYVLPERIVKKRTLKGIPSLEVKWKDQLGFFKGLIPDEQLEIFASDNPKGIDELWSTVEPLNLMEQSYPELVAEFLAASEKPKKSKVPRKRKAKVTAESPLHDLSALMEATNEISKDLKPTKRRLKVKPKKGLQLIDKFLISNKTNEKTFVPGVQCSTPKTKCLPSDLDSDGDENFDMSNIINEITKNSAPAITHHAGKPLRYELTNRERSFDDLDLFMASKKQSTPFVVKHISNRRESLNDTIDLIVAGRKKSNYREAPVTHVDKFLNRNSISTAGQSILKAEHDGTTSFFGAVQVGKADEFEKSMDVSLIKFAEADGRTSDESTSEE